MKMDKLTKNQQRALGKLGVLWKSAYELQESKGTLDALVRRGLADRKHGIGSMAFPRTNVTYRRRRRG